jgi:ABC-type glycerol-3-phosphate transport system substrate-binding protein
MKKLASSTLLFALLALGLAACGSDSGGSSDSTTASTSTFEEDGFGITFEYPSDWTLEDDVSIDSELGSSANDIKAVGIDDSNGIIVESYTLNQEVTSDNIDAAKSELDNLIKSVDPNASGTTGETGGFPSVTFEEVPLTTPTDGQSTLVAVFDQDSEYLINCQSTPDHRDEVQSACDQAIASVQGA